MSEVAFPLLGALFVVLVVLPVSASLAKAGLVLLERDAAGGPLHGLDLRYVLLTGSSLLPLAWLFSAGLHQAETGRSALACLLPHEDEALCFEPGLFALVLASLVLASSLGVARRRRAPRVSSSERARALVQRLERVIASRPGLAGLWGRVLVTDAPGFVLATQGVLRPRVLVGTVFAECLSDDMLASALGHELEHVRARDPLRYALLDLALAVSPFGRLLLEPHAARWRAAREAHCDREAVVRGAAPLPLADAIVRAARPSAGELVALGTPDTALLRLRVEMLLAFAERTPTHCCRRGPSVFSAASVLLLVALLSPHQVGADALDVFHTGVERALDPLLR